MHLPEDINELGNELAGRPAAELLENAKEILELWGNNHLFCAKGGLYVAQGYPDNGAVCAWPIVDWLFDDGSYVQEMTDAELLEFARLGGIVRW